ncbi:MAG: MATE family efflux transporter [Oscillospiraceae bacterium]
MKENFLFEKSFFKAVFSIALPIALQNVISFGVNAMDSIMLGKLGNIAVSGANLGGQPFFLLMIMGFGLSSGGSVLISQYWGKGETDVIRRIMRISMMAITIVSFIFSVGCFVFPQQIMQIFSNEAEVIEASASYLRILAIGFMFYSVSNNYMMSMRAVENVKMSTIVYSISFFVNVIINYAFIFGKFGAPALGIVGAAVGTTVARMVEFVCVVTYMYFIEKKIGYKMHCMFKIDKTLIPDYIKHALPVVGNELMWGTGSVVTSMIMGRIGSTFVTASSITGVIFQLASVFTFGIGNAAAVICGKTIGQGDKERAQKSAQTLLLFAFGFGCLGTLLVLAIRNPFLSIYDVTSEAKMSAYNMMFILALLQPITSLDTVNIIGILRGGGDTKTALMLDAGGMWLINIPMGIITGLVLKIPPHFIYLSMKSDGFIKIIIALRRIISGKWIRTVTREDI